MSRFLYLNIYSFLLAGAGILTLALPFYLISKWILIPQAILVLYFIITSITLFASWKAKSQEIDILVTRNKSEFRPDTFEVFIQAPCGRLVTRKALEILDKSHEYKNIYKEFKKPFWKINDFAPKPKLIFYEEET